MRRLLQFCLAGALTVLVPPAFCQPKPPPVPMPEVPPKPAEELPAPAAQPGCDGAGCHAERRVNVTTVILKEKQCATTVPELKLREVICKDKVPGFVIEYREQKQKVTEIQLKPRTEVKEVVCITRKAVEKKDPCTGKCCTVYEEVPETKKVTITNYDEVPVEREIIVRIPCLKPVEHDVVVKKLVLDERTVPAIEKRWEGKFLDHCIRVPCCNELPSPKPANGDKPKAN